MAWTTITGANTGSIPQGVLKTEPVLDAPVMDFVAGMNVGFGDTTISNIENQTFNPVVMQEQYDAGVAAGGGGSVRPTSGLVFPRGT